MPKVGYDGYQRGMLVRQGPRVVPPGFVRGALNVDMVAGRPTSRPGIRPAHGQAFPSPVRGGGTHIGADGTRDYLVASGAALYRMPLYGDPVLLPLTGLPSTEQTRVDPTAGVRFLSLSGSDSTTFIYDGVNPNLKWDGTSLRKMGLPTPLAPAAPIADVGVAIGAGTRDYFITLRNAQTYESELSAATRVIQGATNGRRFASPVNGVSYDDPQVTRWSLYRTQAGFVKRFLVGTADIGVVINDHVTDLVLGASAVAEQLVNTPPPGKFVQLVEHQSLVFGVDATDRSLVRFSYGTSEYIQPEGWPTERVLPIAHGDGDEITCLVSFFDWLVVFKQLSTWGIVGNLDTGLRVVPILAASGGKRQGIGCIAADAVQHLENEIIFPSRDGFYIVQRFAGVGGGLEAKKISDPIDGLYACANFALGAAATYDRLKQRYSFYGHGAIALAVLAGVLLERIC